MTLQVSEIFRSIQGEGSLAGTVSSFVRLAGCDLHCRWCDTAYARKPEQGTTMSVEQIITRLTDLAANYVVVTGGEPLQADSLAELLNAIHQQNWHITLETAATKFIPITCDLLSISPKLSNSDPDDPDRAQQHTQRRLNIPAIQQYINNYDYQLKFVVEQQSDLNEIDQLLQQLTNIDRQKILLMPQARSAKEHQQLAPTVAQICIERGFRFCPRLHILLWDRQRGV